MQITQEKTSEGPALFPAGDGPTVQSMERFTNIREIPLELIKAPERAGVAFLVIAFRGAPHAPSRGDSAALTSFWNSVNSLALISLIAQKWSPASVQFRMLKPCTFVVLAG